MDDNAGISYRKEKRVWYVTRWDLGHKYVIMVNVPLSNEIVPSFLESTCYLCSEQALLCLIFQLSLFTFSLRMFP